MGRVHRSTDVAIGLEPRPLPVPSRAMTRGRGIAILAGAALLLGGCANNDSASPATTSATAAATTTSEESGVQLSPRGNVIKRPGEVATWELADHSGALTFVADNFTLTPACNGGDPPENGANLIFDLTVNTPATWPAGENLFHRAGYTVVGPDGVTNRDVWQGNTVGCDDFDGQWADELAPGSTYRGKVVLDVPAGSTVVAFNPAQVDSRGFEWPLPANQPAAAPAPTTPAPASPAAAPQPTITGCQMGLGPIVTYWSDGSVTGWTQYCQNEHDQVLSAEVEANQPKPETSQNRNARVRQALIAMGCSTSGCIQTWFGCEDGYITGSDCDYYRAHPIP